MSFKKLAICQAVILRKWLLVWLVTQRSDQPTLNMASTQVVEISGKVANHSLSRHFSPQMITPLQCSTLPF